MDKDLDNKSKTRHRHTDLHHKISNISVLIEWRTYPFPLPQRISLKNQQKIPKYLHTSLFHLRIPTFQQKNILHWSSRCYTTFTPRTKFFCRMYLYLFSICIVWEISTQLTIAHCELFWILVRFCQVLLGLIFPKPFFDKLIKIRQLEAGQEFSTPKKTQDPCVVCFFSNLLYFVKSFFFLHHIRKNTQGQFKNKHQFISF